MYSLLIDDMITTLI